MCYFSTITKCLKIKVFILALHKSYENWFLVFFFNTPSQYSTPRKFDKTQQPKKANLYNRVLGILKLSIKAYLVWSDTLLRVQFSKMSSMHMTYKQM